MNILWVGNPYFAPHLSKDGVTVHYLSSADAPFTWDDLIRLSSFQPDVVVLGDESLPPVLLGVESFPCLTVLYSVDSHIHDWHRLYAQGFDLTMVAMRDHLPEFLDKAQTKVQLLWLPLFARDTDGPAETTVEDIDVLFVGKNDPAVAPGRYAFLTELKKLVPGLEVMQGDYNQLYPRAKIVLNEAERGDLNFRVFEALGCAKCLVTPKVGHGLTDLFTPNTHLACYRLNDPGHAAMEIKRLLASPSERQSLAKAGYAEVNRAHRAKHRAQTFKDWIASQGQTGLIEKRTKELNTIRARYMRPLLLHWAEQLPSQIWRQKLLQAATIEPRKEQP